MTGTPSQTLDRLLDGQNLAEREAGELLGVLTRPELPPAMAGALHVKLGGPRAYGANKVEGVWLGEGDDPVDRTTVRRALSLYHRALALQFLGLALVAALLL